MHTDYKNSVIQAFNCSVSVSTWPIPRVHSLPAATFLKLYITLSINLCICYYQILILINILSHACATRKHLRFFLPSRSHRIALSLTLQIIPAPLCPFWLPCFCISTAQRFSLIEFCVWFNIMSDPESKELEGVVERKGRVSPSCSLVGQVVLIFPWFLCH